VLTDPAAAAAVDVGKEDVECLRLSTQQASDTGLQLQH